MNRVRIISLIAVTLGVAVGAGTLFQQESQRQEAAADIVSVQADTSLVGLAADMPEMGTSPAVQPTVEITAELSAPARPFHQPVSAQISTASVFPGTLGTVDPLADHARGSALLLIGPQLSGDNPAPAEIAEAGVATDPALIEDLLAEVDACAVWLVVTPDTGAMLDMSLFAPCDGGEVVEISHAGLQFDALIGSDGQLASSLPALEQLAEVSVSFADGRTSSDTTEIADADHYDRVAIQWQGPAVLGLNAYESGADYGSDHHIHPANPSVSADPTRGFLAVLGETMQAQVYSFPSGLSARVGQVALEVEVALSDQSCGQPLTIATLEALADAEAIQREIRLEMPECDGQGGFLVLNNILPELTIALN